MRLLLTIVLLGVVWVAGCNISTDKSTPAGVQLCKYVRAHDVAKIKEAIANKDPLDDLGSDGKAALHVAAEEGNLEAAQLLIRGGADVNVKDYSYDSTPVSFAVEHKFNEITNLLLDNGADPYNTDVNKNGVIEIAMLNDDYSLMKDLIERGISVNHPDINGNTPLFHSVVPTEDIKYFDLLIQSGADTTLKNGWKETVLEYAIKMKASESRIEYISRYLPD